MTSGYQVVLDASVLVNAALRDTLLRLAEPPHLYLPRWSRQIMLETQRALEARLGLTPVQTAHLVSELETHFADAWVEGYEELIPSMSNHPKDRHVLAAAVRCGAQTIVTFNLKDFPVDSLALWNVEAQSPDEFLIHQFHLDPHVVVDKIEEQVAQHGGWERLMSIHRKTVPGFVSLISQPPAKAR
jgi:predicted nucleic acid-binding protein